VPGAASTAASRAPASTGPPERGHVARFGHLDLRSEAEFASARRADTPMLVALADVSEADWRNIAAR